MVVWALLVACGGSAPAPGEPAGAPLAEPGVSLPAREETHLLTVRVTLDDAPVEGALVVQPGTTTALLTDSSGTVELPLDLDQTLVGVTASHPEARIVGVELYEPTASDELLMELDRFDVRDNPAYVFQPPGTPEDRETTELCAHCHITINADWDASAHAASARNPWVHDLYAGTAAAFSDAESCAAAGGQWWTGIGPGTGTAAERCYLGSGTLPALNDCGESAPCDGEAENTGQCADCHAPGIDGALGGRDLLEATGLSYEHGVHCDVCHKVESVDLDSDAPGVAGRLRILRPREASPSPTLGDWLPLTFGPYPDVSNIRMGSVQRDHFGDERLCVGCHEHWQPGLVPGAAVDTERWPDGLLPIQTTGTELAEGPLGVGVACQSCHMPPDADVGNSADIGNETDVDEGVAAGWYREAGSVRRHAWFGPRSEEQPMLGLAAELFIEKSLEDGVLDVSIEARNVGPGHAIPTGEPLRSLLLLVEARCDGEALAPLGGDVVWDVGGALDAQDPDGDWSRWPGAVPGERILVRTRTGRLRDDPVPPPFADWPLEDRGVVEEHWAGQSTILAVDPDGTVTLDAPLPPGDIAVRLPADTGLPAEGDPARPWSGVPGFAFAKVLVDAEGQRHVPHFAAVDVVMDNRIPPSAAVTTTHQFAAPCPTPEVEALLLWRRAPLALAQERGWTLIERELTRVTR